jgi:prolyl-tRNA editing enzyme YbaK/EbsC (Cys-tRNA(Pro) deacylase)
LDASFEEHKVSMVSQLLSPSAQKVQATLSELGFACDVIEFSQPTRTAADAAQAVGCEVGQIAKSLVFQGAQTRHPIMVIASGANRVDEKVLSELLGEPITKANAELVRYWTGFTIGGVPPVGRRAQMHTFIDEDLLQYEEIWAAAGTPYAVFRLAPADLVAMTGGQVASIQS